MKFPGGDESLSGRTPARPGVNSAKDLIKLLDSLENVIWSASAENGALSYINQAAGAVYGIEASELLEKPGAWLDMIHDDDLGKFKDFLAEAREKGRAEVEYKIVKPDGEERVIHSRARFSPSGGNGGFINGVSCDINEKRKAESTLAEIMKGVTAATSEGFFPALVTNLARSIDADYAFAGEIVGEKRDRIRTISMYAEGELIKEFEYGLKDTPCQDVANGGLCSYPSGVQDLFPEDELLIKMGIESYIGVPLRDSSGDVLGILVALKKKPMRDAELAKTLFQVFAVRAAGELKRKQSERRLRESHERFLTLLDSLDAAVYVVDMETYEILFANKYIRDIFGDVKGKLCWETFQIGFKEPCHFCTNDKILDEKGKPCGVYEWEFQNTINKRWYSIRDRAMRWVDGRLARLEIATDITERVLAEENLRKSHDLLEKKVEERTAELIRINEELSEEIQERQRAETALRESNALLEKVFATVHNLIAYMDHEFNFIKVNSAYAAAEGRDPEFFTGKNHFDLYPNEENEAIFRKVVETGAPYSAIAKPFVYPHASERGVTYWDWALQPVKESSGKVTGLVLSLLNVTARKNAENELLKSQRMLARAQDMASLGYWEWDIRNNAVTRSKSLERIFGLKTSLPGGAFDDFLNRIVHPDDREFVAKKVKKAIEGVEPYDIDFRILLPSAETRFVHTFGEVERDEAGEPVRMVGALQDITGRKKAEEELRQAKEKAEQATLLKDKFVSLVAHDLKAPFTSIFGMMQIIQEDKKHPVPAAHKEAFERILANSRRLIGMIDDILNISRLKTGKLKLQQTFVDGRVMVQNSMDSLAAVARKKGVELVNDVPDGARLYADRELFGEVLRNLLSNAVKFCNKGDKITALIPPGENTTIAVKDTGVGIDKDILPYIFRHEIKTTKKGTCGEPGTGLGLPFSHDIMTAHGGDLTLEPSKERGSVFYASLPQVKPLTLIVDDHSFDRSILRKHMKKLDAEIIEAKNGKEALFAMSRQMPHLVITDIQMPVMDGLDLLEAIKKDPELKTIPVIVITSDKDMETRQRAFWLGADDFVTKPLAFEDFVPRARRFLI